MLIGALLFAAVFTASGFFLYRKARDRYGSRTAAEMLGSTHLRALAILIVAYLVTRSSGVFGHRVVESIVLFGVTGSLAVSHIVRWRALRRAGSPLLVRDPGRRGRIIGRVLGALLTFGAFSIVAAAVMDGVITLFGVAGFSACLMIALTLLGASGSGWSNLFEAGVIRRYGFLPWSRVQAYRFVEYEESAELQLVLARPWWLRSEITVVIPRANLPTMNAWLGRRLPCLGIQRRLTPRAYRPA